MYKKTLFSYGARPALMRGPSTIPFMKATQSYNGNGRCGSGVKSSMDDQLLSLVRGVSRLSTTPKRKTRKTGSGLRFIR